MLSNLRIYLSAFLLFISFTVYSNVTLPNIFSDNMVLQQKTNNKIWGTATPNSKISIEFSWYSGKKYLAYADAEGNWRLSFITPKYGGPYAISVKQENTITLKNVMIGEVWLCSGQSNMEMPLAGWGKVLNYEAEVNNANYPNIRLFQVLHATSNQPATGFAVRNNGWDVCNPQTVAEFSSTAYFFAREIYNKTKIPIGLIHSSWGGTIAEAWTSYETLQTMEDFAAAARKIRETPNEQPSGDIEAALVKWNEKILKADKGYANGMPQWAMSDLDVSSWKEARLPGAWEDNGLTDFDGVVWYRKTIHLTENDLKGAATLSLGPIDDEDITYINGQQVGRMTIWDADRKYSIPANLLKIGDNVIAVRVLDTGGGGGFHGEDTALYFCNSNGKKISLADRWHYKPSMLLAEAGNRPGFSNNPNRPTVLFNAMIHPILNYTIKGAIWYQGESNAGRAYQYRTLFPTMIKDWRKNFASGEFPFYFVQLASFMKKEAEPIESAWAELREAQLMTTKLRNTGMAVAVDIGDAKDIHPKNKQEVGRRLALIALNKNYNQGNEYSGPQYESHKIVGHKVIITFSHATKMKGSSSLKGFAIAGADKKFYWADAMIKGNQVILSNEKVKQPIAVRYNWANNPDGDLSNQAGLPASPFRTDNWKGITDTSK